MRPLPWVTTGRQTEKEEQWGLPGATAKIGEDHFPTWSTANSHHPGSSGVHPHSFHTRWRWVSTVSGGISQTSATPMWSTLLHIMCLCMGATYHHTGSSSMSLLHPVTCLGHHPDNGCSICAAEAPWIRKWGGVGFRIMGEQGAESIHAEFNRIE